MKRGTFARVTAARTVAVPSALIERALSSSAAQAGSPTTAARWTTASAPSTASPTTRGLRTSPRTRRNMGWLTNPSSDSPLPARVASTTTGCPARTRCAVTTEPTDPAPPVTTTRVMSRGQRIERDSRFGDRVSHARGIVWRQGHAERQIEGSLGQVFGVRVATIREVRVRRVLRQGPVLPHGGHAALLQERHELIGTAREHDVVQRRFPTGYGVQRIAETLSQYVVRRAAAAQARGQVAHLTKTERGLHVGEPQIRADLTVHVRPPPLEIALVDVRQRAVHHRLVAR